MDEEGFVADPQLIHVMQWLPVLCVQVEQVHLTVSVRVLTANEQDFTVRNGQGAAGPARCADFACGLPLDLHDLGIVLQHMSLCRIGSLTLWHVAAEI